MKDATKKPNPPATATVADEYIPLSEARHLIPGKPSKYALHRWVVQGKRHGEKTIFLKAMRPGDRYYTTAAWVAEFVAEASEAGMAAGRESAKSLAKTIKKITQYRQEHERDEAALREAGVIK